MGAKVGDLMGDFWVCQYGRAGNYYGQFQSQVVAPVKKASQCGEGKGHSSGGGAGHVDFEGCVPAGSRQTCQTCTHNVQCANCKDGDKNAGPKILMNGRPMECSRLKIFCNYGFVKRKCKATCNAC